MVKIYLQLPEEIQQHRSTKLWIKQSSLSFKTQIDQFKKPELK